MTKQELADILKNMYSNAKQGEQVAQIHMFGIKYGDMIIEVGSNPKEIVQLSGINQSYDVEVNKGRNIAKLLAADDATIYYGQSEANISGNKRTTHTFLNTILFGPPGTGKTYTTINHALSILMGSEAPVDRTKAKEEFDAYVAKGQIVFTTFHQSYGYEEFIEGIKPDIKPESSEIRYKVQDGVFKALCQTALSKVIQSESISTFNRNKNSVWKFSLGNSQNGEDQIYLEEAIQSDSIILGWGDKTDYSNCKNYNDILQSSGNDKSTARYVNIFKHEIKVGDIAIISDGNRSFKAIVEITGDYFFDTESDLPQKRKIKWLKQFNNPMPYYEISKKYFTQSTINKPQHIDFDKLNKLISHEFLSNTDKNYVIIIDEINRGNISKIFGELITLIEATKRIGAPEELRVALPYSGNEFDDGKGFGVPNNVHIIGTMNTADRSIALMDTALRRRFEFIEMMPDYDVITKEVGTINLSDNDEKKELNIAEMLKTINQRISYLYDRDHQIGHAYLLSLKNKKEKEALLELDNIFRNKIIPLLQEYFYDDWEKIQIVLGDHDKQIKQLYNGKKVDKTQDRFVDSDQLTQKGILGYDDQDDDIADQAISYTIRGEPFTANAYLKITGYLSPDNKLTE